jgi:hypothetical protein
MKSLTVIDLINDPTEVKLSETIINDMITDYGNNNLRIVLEKLRIEYADEDIWTGEVLSDDLVKKASNMYNHDVIQVKEHILYFQALHIVAAINKGDCDVEDFL